MIITRVTSSNGDWEGVYFDDDLAFEGHSIDFDELFEKLEGEIIERYDTQEIDGDEMDKMGNLPPSLYWLLNGEEE
jgi:hypothetical protein